MSKIERLVIPIGIKEDMTYEKAKDIIEVVAIEITGELAKSKNELLEIYLDAIDTAIESMEKQIPKKPTESRIATIEMSAESVNWKIQYCCPVCKHSIIRHIKRNDYCNNCGQAIDWSDEE